MIPGSSAAGRILQREPRARRLLGLAVGTGFAAGVLFALQAVLISVVVDRVFLRQQQLQDVLPLLGLLLLMLLARAGLIWAGDVVAQRSANCLKGSIRRQLTDHMLVLGPVHFRAHGERSGELVNTLVQGVEALDEYVTQYLPALYLAGLVPAFVLLLVLALDPLSTLVLLFAGPMLLMMLVFIGGRAKAITERRFLEMSWMSAHFLDMLQGLPTLKMFGRSREQAETIEEISTHYGNTTMEVLRTAFQTSLVMEWAATAATALVAVEISLRLVNAAMPFDQALAVLLLTPEFFLPLRKMALKYHAGTAGNAAAERMLEILGETPSESTNERMSEWRMANGSGLNGRMANQRRDEGIEPTVLSSRGVESVTHDGTTAPAHETTAASSTPPQLADSPIRSFAHSSATPQAIHFHDVHYAYPTEHQARPALRGLSLAIPEGQTVALVGQTGAGKTTVANLLLRFFDPDQGQILVGGRPLPLIDRVAWRAQLAWVPQHPHLFHGTIADNIRLGKPTASRNEVVAAAQAAHAHEFVEALPHGYETLVGERGARLSGGQLQRIAIARAFLKNAPWLILDEFTAHLDWETEGLVRDALARLMRKRTVLIIAHRLQWAQSADRIVVMEQGVAVQIGDHQELMAQPGRYRQLVDSYLLPDLGPANPPPGPEKSSRNGTGPSAWNPLPGPSQGGGA